VAQGDGADRFTIGKVVAQGLALIGRRAPTLLLLAIVIGWLPRVAIANVGLPTAPLGHWDTLAWSAKLAVTLFHMFLSELLLVCVVHAVLSDRGFVASLTGAAKATSRRLLRLVPLTLILDGPSLLQVLAQVRYSPLFAGAPDHWSSINEMLIWSSVALVADMWIMAWVGVGGAVFIEEPLSVTATLRRAARLLDRVRWKFMGFWVPFYFAGIVLLTVVSLPFRVLRASGLGMFERQFAVTSLETAIFDVVAATFLAVCYRQLRRLKDRPVSEIADVFD
jgi:hypothetical protein